jgi:hypothetical protein
VRFASQRHICALPHDDVCRCVQIIDIWWHCRGLKLHFFRCELSVKRFNVNTKKASQEKVIYMLTDNMQIPELGFRRHRVYLTHVSSLVLLLHIRNVQEPGFVLIVLVMCH